MQNISDFFEIKKRCSRRRARLGELTTAHGKISTPVFMPVGSQATVKTLTPDELKDIGFSIILSNTYHLYLRPGVDVIQKMGGLHNFMGWERPILTDSGGFQIFSLARLRKITEEGVTFRSHIDGSEHLITPELDMQFQEAIGADIIMALDVCSPAEEDTHRIEEDMERTHRWAERCLKSHTRSDQALFGIVQGGFVPELRKRSADYLASLDFPGYAIGGLSIGEPKQQTYNTVEATAPYLPEDKPRYLMGVGAPDDIIQCVERGVDMFDCVLPTRVARNGGLFTRHGRLNIRNSSWTEYQDPVESGCGCYTCRHFSAAYLHHLFRCEELLAYRLATLHNLFFFHNFMGKIRESIARDVFPDFKEDFLAHYRTTDEDTRLKQKQKWLEKHESE